MKDRILGRLEGQGYNVDVCCMCHKPILSCMALRTELNWFEKIVHYLLPSYYFTEWKTNFGRVADKHKGVCCDNCSNNIIEDR